MNILVTGAKGMVGTALVNNLKNIRDGKNCTRPDIRIDEIYEFDKMSSRQELEFFCEKADFVFNLAGVNRTNKDNDFVNGNYNFINTLFETLKKYNNKAPVMLASSIQATLQGRYEGSMYGKTKRDGEKLFFEYGREYGVKVLVYRFPNVMGHSKPNYNSAISTFCNAIANDLEYTVNDPNTEIEVVYIDDLINAMFDAIEGKEARCEYPAMGEIVDEKMYDGVSPLAVKNGKYCFVPTTHKATLGYIVGLLLDFKKQPQTLIIPRMKDNSFEKKLYSLYLTYLPKNKFKYELNMNCDYRGSFTELLHFDNSGQVSVNISEPGIVKGQHWHNTKWEIFMVVYGHGLIQERNINTGEMIEFEVSGDKLEAIYMIPGWTHNIINLSDKEKLITIMFCNEIFDKGKPDTFMENV